MLADVVAIIGETLTRLQRSTHCSCVDTLIAVSLLFFSCDRHAGYRVWRSGPLSNAANMEAPLNSSFSLSVCLSSSFSCWLLTGVDSSSTQCLNNPNKYFTTEQESADWSFTSVSVSADASLFLKYTISPKRTGRSRNQLSHTAPATLFLASEC